MIENKVGKVMCENKRRRVVDERRESEEFLRAGFSSSLDQHIIMNINVRRLLE